MDRRDAIEWRSAVTRAAVAIAAITITRRVANSFTALT